MTDEIQHQNSSDTQSGVQPRNQPIGLDDALGVLSNARRRFVVQQLAESATSEIAIGKLSVDRAVVEHDTKTDPDAINSRERQRVYTGLYQCHLPMMEKAGAVVFDRDGTVRGTDAIPTLARILDRSTDVVDSGVTA